MNVQTAIQQQLAGAHGTIRSMVQECDAQTLNRTLPNATIGSIASVYAHLVFAEDVFVHARFQEIEPLYLAQGWQAKASVPFPGIPPAITPEWVASVRMDLTTFQPYADAVFAATERYVADLADADLERKIKGATGEYPLGWALSVLIAQHAAAHSGEIAALKGVQGLKGLPF